MPTPDPTPAQARVPVMRPRRQAAQVHLTPAVAIPLLTS